MARPPAVALSAVRTVVSSSGPSRSRRPMTLSRTPFSTQRRVSPTRYARKSRISAVTSGPGRCQLSEEKAYTVPGHPKFELIRVKSREVLGHALRQEKSVKEAVADLVAFTNVTVAGA